jgi:RNAse (barnase) inhibitor barstar
MKALFYLIKHKDKFQDIRFKNAFLAKLEGSRCKTSVKLFEELKREFELPDYFGKNLDALYDCLMDLEWITKDHIVLIIEHFDELLSDETNDPEFLEDFLITLDDVSKSWQLMDSDEFTPKTFKVYIQHSDKAKDLLDMNDIEFDVI